MDGEISDGILLNRIVGLFRTDRSSRLDECNFVPDVHFFGGQRKERAGWEESLRLNREELLSMRDSGKRTDIQLEAYDRAEAARPVPDYALDPTALFSLAGNGY